MDILSSVTTTLALFFGAGLVILVYIGYALWKRWFKLETVSEYFVRNVGDNWLFDTIDMANIYLPEDEKELLEKQLTAISSLGIEDVPELKVQPMKHLKGIVNSNDLEHNMESLKELQKFLNEKVAV